MDLLLLQAVHMMRKLQKNVNEAKEELECFIKRQNEHQIVAEEHIVITIMHFIAWKLLFGRLL